MFKCEKCNKITEPREKQNKIPILFRDKVYQYEITKPNGKTYFNTSYGKEIVKEINVCEECYEQYKKEKI